MYFICLNDPETHAIIYFLSFTLKATDSEHTL